MDTFEIQFQDGILLRSYNGFSRVGGLGGVVNLLGKGGSEPRWDAKALVLRASDVRECVGDWKSRASGVEGSVEEVSLGLQVDAVCGGCGRGQGRLFEDESLAQGFARDGGSECSGGSGDGLSVDPRERSRDVDGVGEGVGKGVFSGVIDGNVGVAGSFPVVAGSVPLGGSVGSFPVSGGTKKKRGKNQRDREKRGKGVVLPPRSVADGNWRKGTGSVSGSVPVVVGEALVQGDPAVVDKSGVFVTEVKSRARESLEKKWEVENRVAIAKAELAEEKAKKDLEFQRARDVEAEIRRSRTLVMKQTESNKVATEKAFATLRATGNVPGFCETVVSGGGSVPGLSGGSSAEDCMISPDSSASMHEFREAQKKVLDLEDKIRKMERAEKMRATVGEVAITNDGDEPTPSLQEEMDRQDEKYNTQYVYEPAAIGGKNVLLLRCETFGDYCEGEDY